ncbi:Uncharacterised protein [Mycobacterium tuberculosis]|nr:Uncharacterised protein [Mycobacterium tuberculosis]
MRSRSACEVTRSLPTLRLSARETVIFDTPTRAATSAMVGGRDAGAEALVGGNGLSRNWVRRQAA